MNATLSNAVSDILDVSERCAGVFETAAERSLHLQLRVMFARRAAEYEQAGAELLALILKRGCRAFRIGCQPALNSQATAQSSDAAGAVSESGSDHLALLDMCERLELEALECYGRASLAAPAHYLSGFIECQRAMADANLGQVRAIVRAALARQCEDSRRNRAHVNGLREQVLARSR